MFVKFFFIIQFEQQIDQQNLIIKFATVYTLNLIKNFKAEKLNGYYDSLRSCSEVQLKNSEHVRDRLLKLKINSLWLLVGSDKNIKSLNTD